MPRKVTPITVYLRVSTKHISKSFPEYTPDIPELKAYEGQRGIQYDKFEPVENAPVRTNPTTEVVECNMDYKNAKLYPKTTRMKCWWDGHEFDNKPFFIPKEIIEGDGEDHHNVYGNFCSPECAMAYLQSESSLDSEVKWERTMLLHEMCNRVYNDKKTKIQPALPRWTLKDYGGGLSIEEYREVNTHTSDNCEIIYPPITVDIPVLQLVNRDEKPAVVEKVLIKEERFIKAEENLSKQMEVLPEKRGILDLMNIRVDEV